MRASGQYFLTLRRVFSGQWLALIFLKKVFLVAGFFLILPRITAQSTGNTNSPVESATGPILHPVYGVGSWIWAEETRNKQTVRFWQSFQIPKGSPVAEARLRISADNGYSLFLDGREIGRGSDYRTLSDYDLREARVLICFALQRFFNFPA